LVQGFNLDDKLGTVGQIGIGAITGRTAKYLSGGDFAMGAISGVWTVMFNHIMELKVAVLFKNVKTRLR